MIDAQQRKRKLIDVSPSGDFFSTDLLKQVSRALEARGRLATAIATQETTPRAATGDTTTLLGERLKAFKFMTTSIAMYLDADWRKTLLADLEEILSIDDWDEEFAIPEEYSFATFLRMMIYLHPTKRPRIGLSKRGHFIGSWTKDGDRMVIECLRDDELRWVLSQRSEDFLETASGTNQIHRLPDLIVGYEPERFFSDGDRILS